MISLRKYTLSDSEILAKYIGDPEVLINLSDGVPNPYSIKDAKEFIVSAIETNNFRFAIEYNDEYCGGIGLDNIPYPCGHPFTKELGYWIAKPFWNKGIATQAIRLICEKGFDELKLVRIEAYVFEYNKVSMRVLEKCNFVKEEVQAMGAIKNGNMVNSYRFALVR